MRIGNLPAKKRTRDAGWLNHLLPAGARAAALANVSTASDQSLFRFQQRVQALGAPCAPPLPPSYIHDVPLRCRPGPLSDRAADAAHVAAQPSGDERPPTALRELHPKAARGRAGVQKGRPGRVCAEEAASGTCGAVPPAFPQINGVL